MKKYVGTKQISAKQMTRGEYNEYRGWKIPKDENPDDEGYLVRYSDGYESWSPKKQFEEAYRVCDNMTFGLAIEEMKSGKKVSRRGWNGKDMFIFLAYPQSFTANAEVDKSANSNWSVAMKTADNSIVIGWLASQTDMLADDWCIVD